MVQVSGHCWVLCRMVTQPLKSVLPCDPGPWCVSYPESHKAYHEIASVNLWLSGDILHLMLFSPPCNLLLFPGPPCTKKLIFFRLLMKQSLCIWIYANGLQEGSPTTPLLQSWFRGPAWVQLSCLQYIISFLLLLDNSSHEEGSSCWQNKVY